MADLNITIIQENSNGYSLLVKLRCLNNTLVEILILVNVVTQKFQLFVDVTFYPDDIKLLKNTFMQYTSLNSSV